MPRLLVEDRPRMNEEREDLGTPGFCQECGHMTMYEPCEWCLNPTVDRAPRED